MNDDSSEISSYLTLTVSLLSAYVTNNTVESGKLPELIRDVHRSLQELDGIAPDSDTNREPRSDQTPAVSVDKSVTHDFIVCLEDGQRFRSLRRHLRSAFGMTPDEYRRKWGLADDYPMVAPALSEARSRLAKEIGLAQRAKDARSSPPRDAPDSES